MRETLEWMKCYMSEWSQSVVWNNVTSKSLDLSYGMPQGSILGPLLFLVMVADLPGYVTQGTTNNVNSKMTCFADDSAVYASSKCASSLKMELERMSERMIQYCQKFGLVINVDKTQMLVSGVKSKDFSVRVGTNIVCPSNELKLLGVASIKKGS